MKFQGTLVGITAIAIGFLLTGHAGSEKPGVTSEDSWSGEYLKIGGFDSEKCQRVTIWKEGDHYRFNLKHYKEQKFAEVKPGVLEAEYLGQIHRDTSRFDDPNHSGFVLRAGFCYELFNLVRLPCAIADKKPESR